MENQGDKARVEAVLQVSVSANKELYEEIYKEEPKMCQALKEIMEEDFKKAEAKGEARGENKLGNLITKLISLGRNQDVEKAARDPAYREKLYVELGIA